MTRFNVSSVGVVKKDTIEGMDKDYVFSVLLDKNILDGLDDATIRQMAEDSAVITLQGNIRRKGLTRDTVVHYLKEKGFDAVIGDYEFAEAKPVDNKKIKLVIANVLEIPVEKVTDEMVDKAKGLTK